MVFWLAEWLAEKQKYCIFTLPRLEALEHRSGPLRNFHSGSVRGCHGKFSLILTLPTLNPTYNKFMNFRIFFCFSDLRLAERLKPLVFS